MSNENRERARAYLDFALGGARDFDGLMRALTSELAAAEQRGRQRALEEAAQESDRFEREAGQDEFGWHQAAGAISKRIRSLGSTGGGR